MGGLKTYLADPELNRMYQTIRNTGAIKSISVDLTDECNLRCTGCYFFEEGMDKVKSGSDEAFLHFIQLEKQRGTNFVTVVGGEPALDLPKLKLLHENFKVNVATNGLIKVPYEGFETMPLGIAVWGDHATDSRLRGNGKRDLFEIAKKNYKNDTRAFWYYTVAPGCADQVEGVVQECIDNGNKVLFNYYSDLSHRGGELDYHNGFEGVKEEIDRMIDQYPTMIYTTRHFNEIVTSGMLFGDRWGYDVCTNLSENVPQNQERFKNKNPYNPHFRAYNSDYLTTRRCCTGIERDCDSCFDTWEHFSWMMSNLRKYLESKESFTRWLTTMYMFYMINRLIPIQNEEEELKRVHGLLKDFKEPISAQ
ncbi:MAG: hypothetical protein OEY34_02705 [Cyclobacteriaceae bacterium]|nr:hypothetical protein [Cyclobacteriaceae bacterium]